MKTQRTTISILTLLFLTSCGAGNNFYKRKYLNLKPLKSSDQISYNSSEINVSDETKEFTGTFEEKPGDNAFLTEVTESAAVILVADKDKSTTKSGLIVSVERNQKQANVIREKPISGLKCFHADKTYVTNQKSSTDPDFWSAVGKIIGIIAVTTLVAFSAIAVLFCLWLFYELFFSWW